MQQLYHTYNTVCAARDCFPPQSGKREWMLSEYLTCSVFIRQTWATVNCTALSMCHVFYSWVSNRTKQPAWRPTDICPYNAKGFCPRRRRHHLKCYCSPARTWRLSAHSLLTYAHTLSALSNRGPTAARHSLHQMHFSMQWAGGLHASVAFHFAEGVGSDVHWIKSVVLVNYQGYLVQIKLGESHVWVVGFSLQWCPAWTFVLWGFMSVMVKAELESCHAVAWALWSNSSQVMGEIWWVDQRRRPKQVPSLIYVY